ncbi:MAG: hypothetical protein ACLVG6_00345 [Dorea formicigenerans]
MMNSRWQANKIGLINFWYYDEQEFPFVKGKNASSRIKWLRKICYDAERSTAFAGWQYESGTIGSIRFQRP